MDNIFTTNLLGKQIALSDKCKTVWGAVREGKIYEEGLIGNFYQHLKGIEGPINIFDIGANTGAFIYLPIFDNRINVWAYEPNKLTFDILNQNIELNSLTNSVKTYNVGVWNTNTQLEFKVPNDVSDSGIATFCEDAKGYFSYDEKQGEHQIQIVQVKTIDTLFEEAGIQSLQAIKIDVEGAELNVLKGGESVIKKFHPMILFEYHDRAVEKFGYKKEEILELLKSWGYQTIIPLATSDLLAIK